MTSDLGPGHAKVKKAWPCSPKRHCFYLKTPTLLEGGGGLSQCDPHPPHRASGLEGGGEKGVSLSGQIREATLASVGVLLMLKLILLQTLTVHLPTCLQNVLAPKAGILSLGHMLESSGEILKCHVPGLHPTPIRTESLE